MSQREGTLFILQNKTLYFEKLTWLHFYFIFESWANQIGSLQKKRKKVQLGMMYFI